MTNAVRYAVGPISLRLIQHSVLVCEVMDGSSTVPRLRHARAMDEGGRGLFLVAQTTHRWGTRYTSDGKVIWAEQRLPDGVAADAGWSAGRKHSCALMPCGFEARGGAAPWTVLPASEVGGLWAARRSDAAFTHTPDLVFG